MTTRKRKNIFIDQERIDRVRALLGTDTETETIDRALEMAEDYERFKVEVTDAWDEIGGKGGFVDHFASPTKG